MSCFHPVKNTRIQVPGTSRTHPLLRNVTGHSPGLSPAHMTCGVLDQGAEPCWVDVRLNKVLKNLEVLLTV